MSRHCLGQAGQRLRLEFIYKSTELNQMRSSNYGPVLIMVTRIGVTCTLTMVIIMNVEANERHLTLSS